MPRLPCVAGVGCSKCKEPCYDQRCMACSLPLCQQCVSRPHQCGSRCRAALNNPSAAHDHHSSKTESGAGPSNGAAWKWKDLTAASVVDIDTEARDLSSSSMNSEREISSSSISSTGSAGSRRPWHRSEPSQELFSQYCNLRQKQKDEDCVVQ